MTKDQLEEALQKANYSNNKKTATIKRLRKACFKYIGERNDAVAECKKFSLESKKLKAKIEAMPTGQICVERMREAAFAEALREMKLLHEALEEMGANFNVSQARCRELNEKVEQLQMLARADEKVKSALRSSNTQCATEVRLIRRENEQLRAECSTWNRLKNIILVSLGGASFVALVKLISILS